MKYTTVLAFMQLCSAAPPTKCEDCKDKLPVCLTIDKTFSNCFGDNGQCKLASFEDGAKCTGKDYDACVECKDPKPACGTVEMLGIKSSKCMESIAMCEEAFKIAGTTGTCTSGVKLLVSIATMTSLIASL